MFWGNASANRVYFRENAVQDCRSGAGTGGGGLGVLYLGARSDGNAHEVSSNQFERCSGGSDGAYYNSSGGGGAGGFAIVYAQAARRRAARNDIR